MYYLISINLLIKIIINNYSFLQVFYNTNSNNLLLKWKKQLYIVKIVIKNNYEDYMITFYIIIKVIILLKINKKIIINI